MLQVVLKLELYLETNVETPNWGFAKPIIKIFKKLKAAFSFHQTIKARPELVLCFAL